MSHIFCLWKCKDTVETARCRKLCHQLDSISMHLIHNECTVTNYHRITDFITLDANELDTLPLLFFFSFTLSFSLMFLHRDIKHVLTHSTTEMPSHYLQQQQNSTGDIVKLICIRSDYGLKDSCDEMQIWCCLCEMWRRNGVSIHCSKNDKLHQIWFVKTEHVNMSSSSTWFGARHRNWFMKWFYCVFFGFGGFFPPSFDESCVTQGIQRWQILPILVINEVKNLCWTCGLAHQNAWYVVGCTVNPFRLSYQMTRANVLRNECAQKNARRFIHFPSYRLRQKKKIH